MNTPFYVVAVDAADAEQSVVNGRGIALHATAAYRAALMTNDDHCKPRCEYKVYRVTVTVEETE